MTPALVVAVLLGPLVVYIAAGAIRDAIRDRVYARRDLQHREQMNALGRAAFWSRDDGEAWEQP